MRRAVLLLIAALPLLAARAEAVTIKEIIELTRAGLSDEVLLALIEVDQRVFSIDPATLKELKAAGVSEPVIVALIRSGRMAPIEPPLAEPLAQPEPPAPQVIVIDHEPVVREVAVPVAVPVYFPVFPQVRGHHRAVPVNPAVPPEVPIVGQPPPSPRRAVHARPVYWGWGGKLRPDAWKPGPDEQPNRPRPER